MSGASRAFALVASIVLVGCLDASVTSCPGDITCPREQVCDTVHGGCILAEQQTVCETLQQGDDCTFGGGTPGICSDGICVLRRCGDGFKRGTEQCDLDDLDGITDCTQLDFHEPGAVKCTDDCRYDTSACGTFCGDHVVNGAEQCDDLDLGGLDSCQDLGFYDDAPLTCSHVCSYDVSACTGFCGDGLVNGAEQCDGADLGNAIDCTSIGYYSAGALACGTGCRYDVLGCTGGVCGDHVKNGPEDCDDQDIGAATCQDLGYYDPVLPACTGLCTFDASGCTGFCGDRALDPEEICEGQPPPGDTCASLGYDEGSLGCRASCGPDFSTCVRHGWRTDPAGTSNVFWRGGWANRPDDAFVVGDSGRISHWDGLVWTAMATGTAGNLRAVWGSGANDVYVVGPTLRHYDGTGWSAIAGTAGLRGIWGTSASNILAVGNAGLIERYDGTSWSTMLSANGAGLNGVWTDRLDDAYAVGDSGAIVHYDGASWSTMASPTTVNLTTVWGNARDDVFAGGDDGSILHFDGGTWTVMLKTGAGTFTGLWGRASDDVYASSSGHAILHYDGNGWSPVAEAQVVSPNGAWALFGVGSDLFGAIPYVEIIHADLQTWRTMHLPHLGNTVEGVFALAPDDVWTVSGGDGVVQHFDGATWTQTTTPEFYFEGIWASSPTDVFAIGYAGDVQHWDGVSWQQSRTGSEGWMFDGWGTGPNDLFIVGDLGATSHWNGATWTDIPAPTGEWLRDVWGSAPDDYVAVGDNGTVLHYDGASWTPISSPVPGAAWMAVWGLARDDYYIGGAAGIYHWDGAAWTQQSPLSTRQIWGSGPNDIYATGVGAIEHYDGLGWGGMTQENGTYLTSVTGAGHAAFVSTYDGNVERLIRSCTDHEITCDDNLDDDCDGDYDCVDADCAGAAACPAGGACAGAIDLACNTPIGGTTNGGSLAIDRYGCSPWFDAGRHVAYRLQPTTSGPVTVSLSNLATDLDLIVLAQGPGGGCDVRSSGCLGASSTTGDEQVTFDATAGTTYDVVVDGYGSSSGSFDLVATCP